MSLEDVDEEPGPQYDAQTRRGSLFEVPASHRSKVTGCSQLFYCEPKNEGSTVQQKRFQHENTYRLDVPVKYKADTVTAIIQDVLKESLTEKTYEPGTCAFLCKSLAEDVKEKVKLQGFERYKIVSLVSIGEKKEQGVQIGSRFAWDADRDSYSSANFENASLFAVGTVYAVYQE